MKSIRSRKQSLQKAYKAEKNAKVSRRIQLVMFILIDGMNASEAARQLKMSRSWGPKWARRSGERGWPGSRTCPEAAGRPRRIRA